MVEFEYTLLIVHNSAEVREDLIKLFDGTAPENMEALDMNIQYREYEGKISVHIHGDEGPKEEQRKLFIHTATSAQEYRMSWRDHLHHAVLLNLALPEDTFSEPRKETGMNLLKEIKRDHPQTEVIVFTDQMVANRAIEAVKNGAFYFIQQPQIYLEFVQALVARIIQMTEGTYLDTLTDLYNRRFFQNSLKDFWEESSHTTAYPRRDHRTDLSLIQIDLNDFKNINDTYGHPEGDKALHHIARIIAGSFRKTDVIGRIGGDEFAAIVPYTDHLKALEIAERLRYQIEVQQLELRRGNVQEKVRLTISAGVATYPQPNPVSNVEAFVKAADEALYHAKKEFKKNAVCGYRDNGMIFSVTLNGMK
jgi:diguanylate cyclase (GGDEF)-like protein